VNDFEALAAPRTDRFELPNLCAPQAVLLLILAAVLLAVVMVLFASGYAAFDWVLLGRTATFVLWTMLGSAALLCLLREYIARLPLPSGAMLAWGLVMAVCALTSCTWQWALSELIDGQPGHINVDILLRDLLICALIAGVVLRYFYLQAELIAGHRAELGARLDALQARIRPHFLFNSMNIIASLIELDPKAAEGAVEDLSELFRASLREQGGMHSLHDELDLCARYMRLEQLRMGERMRYRVEDEALDHAVSVPQLSVQPLLENAVYHGIQPRADGGEVCLTVTATPLRIQIQVVNPVARADLDTPGSGIALHNIRERLRMLYPSGGASLDTRVVDGAHIATLNIPKEAA